MRPLLTSRGLAVDLILAVLLTHLSLTNFRNYRQLEIDVPSGTTLIGGENAQGKTNFLEAIYLLATTRSPRTSSEADFVNWQAAREEENPITRVAGQGTGAAGRAEVEIALTGRPSGRGRRGDEWPDEIDDPAGPQLLSVSKRIRVNGIPRRATDAIGVMPSVFFSTLDMDIICGSPSLRRRFLDLMLSQVDRPYLGALTRYARVLQQRNALLKRIQDGSASTSELDFWDGEIAKEAAVIVAGRASAVLALSAKATEAHHALASHREKLSLRYQPRLGDGAEATVETTDEARARVTAALRAGRPRDCGAGMTLVGPHRDELAVLVDGASAAAFASRAQQRSAALALRLGEANLITGRLGEQPSILLDDVLSELDRRRQEAVMEAISRFSQVLVTSAEPERFPGYFRQTAFELRVEAGVMTTAASGGGE